MRVFVVTDSDLGWDNIVAVYFNEDDAVKHVKDRNGGKHGTSTYSDETVEDEYEGSEDEE